MSIPKDFWDHIQSMKRYSRHEDMSPNGTIGVFIQSDGDVILTVYSEEHKMAQMASAEFCTYSGGGKSSRVREALLNLALAIKLDNDEDPSRRPE